MENENILQNASDLLKDIVTEVLPKKYVNDALIMVKDLLDKNVIKLEGVNNVIMGKYKIPIGIFLRGIFVKNASIFNYKLFFDMITPHVYKYINNPKLNIAMRGGRYWLTFTK